MEVFARARVWHGARQPCAQHPVEADLGPASVRIVPCTALVSLLPGLL